MATRTMLQQASLPVIPDAGLGSGQRNASVANFPCQAHLKFVLPLGAVVTIPLLQLEVVDIARMAAECQWNDVVEFVIAGIGPVDTLFAHQFSLHAVGIGGRRADGLGVALVANRFGDRRFMYVGVEDFSGLSAGACRYKGEYSANDSVDFHAAILPQTFPPEIELPPEK
jgi:hypothetical protein